MEEQDDAPQPSRVSIPQLDGVVDLTSEPSDAESQSSLDEDDDVQAGHSTGNPESVSELPAPWTSFRFADTEMSSSPNSVVESDDQSDDQSDAHRSRFSPLWDSMSSSSEDGRTDFDEEAASDHETEENNISTYSSDSESEDAARDDPHFEQSPYSASPSPEQPASVQPASTSYPKPCATEHWYYGQRQTPYFPPNNGYGRFNGSVDQRAYNWGIAGTALPPVEMVPAICDPKVLSNKARLENGDGEQHNGYATPHNGDTSTNEKQATDDAVELKNAKVAFLSELRAQNKSASAFDPVPDYSLPSSVATKATPEAMFWRNHQRLDQAPAFAFQEPAAQGSSADAGKAKTVDTNGESANGKQVAPGLLTPEAPTPREAANTSQHAAPTEVNLPQWDSASVWHSVKTSGWEPSSAWELQLHKRYSGGKPEVCSGCEAPRTGNPEELEQTSSERPSDSSHPILGEVADGSQNRANDETDRSSTEVQTKDKGKRKAELISTMDEADLQWTSTNGTAGDMTAAPETPSTSTTNVQSQLPSPPTSPQDMADPEARPAKKMKRIAERVGFAALGGATVGAMVLTTLIYSAPTFA